MFGPDAILLGHGCLRGPSHGIDGLEPTLDHGLANTLDRINRGCGAMHAGIRGTGHDKNGSPHDARPDGTKTFKARPLERSRGRQAGQCSIENEPYVCLCGVTHRGRSRSIVRSGYVDMEHFGDDSYDRDDPSIGRVCSGMRTIEDERS